MMMMIMIKSHKDDDDDDDDDGLLLYRQKSFASLEIPFLITFRNFPFIF